MASDFTDLVEMTGGTFVDYELDEDVDFVETGDEGLLVVIGFGYGEGGYGEGGYGGEGTIIISGFVPTIWTDIDTP